MKKLLILSLALITGLIYSDLAHSRSKARTLSDVKSGVSGSSSGSYSGSSGAGSSASSMVGDVEAPSNMKYYDGSATYYGGESKDKVELQKIKPFAKRMSCAELWNGYYEKEEINIKVKTRGNYHEQILFICPTCTDEEHFIKPFVESEYQGHSGMDRISSCGFDYAVFKGGRGFNEVIVEVPKHEM